MRSSTAVALTTALMPAMLMHTVLAPVVIAPAGAAESGAGARAEAAVAMVKRVEAKAAKDGLEAAIQAVNGSARDFKDRELYAFIMDFDGVTRADAGTPAVIGQNLLDLGDEDGKFFARDLIAIARERGGGWSDYRWPNPVTKTVEDKSTYVERIGESMLAGAGVYRNVPVNDNTVGLISGSPNADDTYLQIAYELAEVLSAGGDIRVLPVAGIGGPRNIRDVRYVRGIDIGLTQTAILNNFRRSNERMGQTENKIVYIAKLFTEEVHLVARAGIATIGQLRGLKVNLDVKGSGASYSMRDIFKALGVEVEEVGLSQAEALQKVRSGEIAATALIAGKPVKSLSLLGAGVAGGRLVSGSFASNLGTDGGGLHFVAIPFSQPLMADYLPANLTHDDYPNLVPAGQSVETIAVGAVLIAYDWPAGGDRYKRVQKFVDSFFDGIDEFKKPQRHPKWREVNLAATLPGWTRFEGAQNWLDRQRMLAASRSGSERPDVPNAMQADDARLYQEFLTWRQQHLKLGMSPNP